MKRAKVKDDYPVWVCNDCAKSAGGKPAFRFSTYHVGTCGVCKKTARVTEPRDWGYPEFHTKDKGR